MTHTPGPWSIFSDRADRTTIGSRIARICDMHGKDPAFYTDEDAANARLIAASPELLEALERWISMALNSGLEGCDEILEQAEAAIAKAKGQEEEDTHD
jgi:hypothetical protein